MPSVEIVDGFVRNHLIGSTNVSNPRLFMSVNGVPCGSSYIIQDLGNSKRTIFPRVTSNGQIYITAMGQVYGNDLPAITPNIIVYVGVLMVERVNITNDRIILRNASNNVAFDTDRRYVRTDNNACFVVDHSVNAPRPRSVASMGECTNGA